MDYAKKCGASFLFTLAPDKFLFSSLNFYKLILIEKYLMQFDNVLYLDFDVVPNTDENIFELYPDEFAFAFQDHNPSSAFDEDVSPNVKFETMFKLCMLKGIDPLPKTINTGVILANQSYHDLKIEDARDRYAVECIHHRLPLNNEAFFSYLIAKKQIPYTELPTEWNSIYDRSKKSKLDRNAKFIHFINKRFEELWPNED